MRKIVLAGVISLAFAITAVPAASGPFVPIVPAADDLAVTQVAKKGGGGGGRGGVRSGGSRGESARGSGTRFSGRRAGDRRAHAGVRRGHARGAPRKHRGRVIVRCGWRGGTCHRGVRYWPRHDRYDRDDDIGVESGYPAYCPVPGTQAWHAFCASKYVSYKPWTSTFTTRSGNERYCICQ